MRIVDKSADAVFYLIDIEVGAVFRWGNKLMIKTDCHNEPGTVECVDLASGAVHNLSEGDDVRVVNATLTVED